MGKILKTKGTGVQELEEFAIAESLTDTLKIPLHFR